MKEILQAFREVFPGSRVYLAGKEPNIQPTGVRLGCNYAGHLQTVTSEVCLWHIEEGDPICLNECENLWVQRNLNHALNAALKRRKGSTPLAASSPSVDGVSRGLWG